MTKTAKSGAAMTACCLKTPSMGSVQGVQETALNNNNFHAMSHQKIQNSFPKKSAVDLKFKHLYYKARTWSLTKKPVTKEILHGVSGEFRAGELTAIMGPSGAGKSTLLNILAGYKVKGSEGFIMVNGRERNLDKFGPMSCYIMQDDALRPKLTVMESMTIAAHLKLGFGMSSKAKEKQLLDLLDMLGLQEHLHTRASSLSGGQKKRLSVALELISNPPVLFLDEPTTGLDSSSCSQCVSLLKLLAQQGRTVICTIHQPTALLFEMFDHLYTLADGNCIYEGGVSDLLPFLSSLGLQCPRYHNPADFLIEVAIGEYDSDVNLMAASAAKNVDKRRKMSAIKVSDVDIIMKNFSAMHSSRAGDYEPPAYASLASSEDFSIDETDDTEEKKNPPNMILQFFILYYRNLISLCRSYTSFFIRILAHLVIGIVFGYLYQDVGSHAESVFGNYVFLYGTTLFLVYTSKMAVTLSIPMEMNMLRREHFNRWYSLLPSFLAVILIEIPVQILGSVAYVAISHHLTGQTVEPYRVQLFYLVCIVGSLTAQSFGFVIGVLAPLKIAVFLGPTIAVVFSTFGFNIFYRHIPDYFLWLYHISYFRAAFHSLLVVTYGENRTVLPCRELYCHYKYPQKLLEEFDIRDTNITENTVFVGSLGILLHICTVCVIWLKLNRR